MLIELLEDRKRELEEAKAAIEAVDDTEEIEKAVAEFREKVVAEYAEKKAAAFADVELEIRAVERLIEKEVAKEQEALTEIEVEPVEGIAMTEEA